MLTHDRMNQFLFLLSVVSRYIKMNLSVRDAGICAFYSTAEEYNVKEPTIRDMVTRICDVKKIENFYTAIELVYSENIIHFQGMYYSSIPEDWHGKITRQLTSMANSKIQPPNESPEPLNTYMKLFTKASKDEKRQIILLLSKKIEENSTA